MLHNPANLIDREAAGAWGRSRSRAHDGVRGATEHAMRSVIALGLLVALCTSASAAKVHHSKARDAIVRSQGEVVPPGWYKFPGYPPIPPEQN